MDWGALLMDIHEIKSPKAMAEEGSAYYQKGEFYSAAVSFEAASQAYSITGDRRSEAEMANNSSVAYLQAGKADKALTVLEGTAEIFESEGDIKRQGMALGNQAAALEALGRFDEAEQAYKDSAALLENAGEEQLKMEVMKSLSMMQLNMGRRLEALMTMQSGVEDLRHPNLKQSLLKRLLNIPFEILNKK